MGSTAVSVSAIIDGRRHNRDALLAWEARRFSRAAAKIGLPAPAGSLEQRRFAFADAKLALGPEEIGRRLAREVKLGDLLTGTTARLSHGRRNLSMCHLHITGGSAAEFRRWMLDTTRADFLRSMVAASPDHFLFRVGADGTQEVIETTGGSPLATRFFIDLADTTGLTSVPHSDFPVRFAGAASTATGRAIGGVRHQFRDEPAGFHASLCVEFPRFLPPRMISQHRWHLATEFANWIEFAFSRSG